MTGSSHSASRQTSPFLQMAALGFALSTIASVYRGIYWWYAHGPTGDTEGLHSAMQLAAAGDGLGAVLTLTGVFGAAHRLRGPMILAAIGAAVFSVHIAGWTILLFGEMSTLAAFWQAIPWPVYAVAYALIDIGLIAALHRQVGAQHGRASAWVKVAAGLIVLGWGWTIANRLGWSPDVPDGAGFLASSAVSAVRTVTLIIVLLAIARLVAVRGQAGLRTTGASTGLRLFSTGLKMRIVCLIATVGVALLFAVSGSVAGAKVSLYSGTLLSMIAGVMMVAGLARYAFSLGSHDVAGILATVLMTLGLLLDVWVLQLLNDLFGDRLGAAMDAQKSLGWVQGIGQVLGLVAMLGLLTSLREVARFGGNFSLARRASGLMGLVVLVAGLATAVRFLANMRALPAALGIAAGLLALMVAVVMILRLLGLIGDVARQLEDDATGDPVD